MCCRACKAELSLAKPVKLEMINNFWGIFEAAALKPIIVSAVIRVSFSRKSGFCVLEGGRFYE